MNGSPRLGNVSNDGSRDFIDCPISPAMVIIVGVLLRVVFLATRPLNVDESWTMLVALSELSLLDTTTFEKSADPHPLLFYGLYRLLGNWISSADWSFRIPVACFSILSLVGFWLFMRIAELPRALQSWSLLLFAVLPVNIYYAYDARAYSMAQLSTIFVLTAYSWRLQKQSWISFSLLVLSVGISSTFDVIGWVVVGAIVMHQATSRNVLKQLPTTVATFVGTLLASGYFYMRFLQFTGVTMDQSRKPAAMSVVLDGLMQLAPFGLGQGHALSLPGGLLIYCLLVLCVFAVLTRAFLWFVGTRNSTFRLLWFLFLLPFAGQVLLGLVFGGLPLHRRYLLVLIPGLVPIFAIGTLLLSTAAMKWWFEFCDTAKMWRACKVFAMLVLGVIPIVVSVGMNKRLGYRSDWRSLHDQIGNEIQETDGFLHPFASPARGFVLGPLICYARMQGTSISTSSIFDPCVAIENPEQTVSIDDVDDWATTADQLATVDFIEQHRGRRVWSFQTPVASGRFIDLGERAILLGRWQSHRVEARLYGIPEHVSSTSESR